MTLKSEMAIINCGPRTAKWVRRMLSTCGLEVLITKARGDVFDKYSIRVSIILSIQYAQ
jgi:hypothetical protein